MRFYYRLAQVMIAVAMVASLGCSSSQETDMVIVAHRGYCSIAPENTLSSLKLAKASSDMAEFDVRACSTGELVLMHDSKLDRTTDGSGKTEETPFSVIRTLDCGSWYSPHYQNEPVATLSEALECLLPETKPLIEHKSGTPAAYAKVLKEMGVEDCVVVQSFSWDFLEGLRSEMPNVCLGALGGSKYVDGKSVPAELTAEEAERLSAINVWMIGWRQDAVTPKTIETAHNAGIKVFAWTVDGGPDAIRLAEMGVDGIITNRPEAIRTVITSLD